MLIRWTVVILRGEKWVRLQRTYFKVQKNAQKCADRWQREFPDETIRLKQHPPVVVVDGKHMLGGKVLFPGKKLVETVSLGYHRIVGNRRILVGDLLPEDWYAFDNGGISDYWESTKWEGDSLLVVWNADNSGMTSYYENRFGERITPDRYSATGLRNDTRRVS